MGYSTIIENQFLTIAPALLFKKYSFQPVKQKLCCSFFQITRLKIARNPFAKGFREAIKHKYDICVQTLMLLSKMRTSCVRAKRLSLSVSVAVCLYLYIYLVIVLV